MAGIDLPAELDGKRQALGQQSLALMEGVIATAVSVIGQGMAVLPAGQR